MRFKLKDYTWATIIVWIGLMVVGIAVLATQARADAGTASHAVAVVHPAQKV